MNIKKSCLFLFILVLSYYQTINSQPVDSTSFKIFTRLSFYSLEKRGELLLHLPASLTQSPISVSITAGGKIIGSWSGKAGKSILRIPVETDFSPSVYNVEARIALQSVSKLQYQATTELIILSYKANEVKTDRLTGGMIVNNRQFFPFGFYCYSPVSPTLPEEEIVKGFNMISPYQKIAPETLGERKAYMDRCAELGMKVHYNLISISGGGGVGSKIGDLSPEEKRLRLIEEIKIFMNHPALLAWYIADEPNGFKIPPETLEDIYHTVKDTDPWHPVSIVFMAPFLSSKKYENALDIVMADPYPVPTHPITLAGDVSGLLRSEFTGKRAVWMVLQAFGGGEWWGREPTIQELRSMTWQSIIKGATGIQYFVRQGLNYFPKSVAAWNECGRMAMEVAEITPWLLSDEETFQVESSTKNVLVTSKVHDGQLLVMAVNKINQPVAAAIRIKGVSSGIASLIFENRSLPVSGGLINDYLAPYGSQVYLLDLKPVKKNPVIEAPENLLKDPGFEDFSTPGVPSACYARPGGDRGATYFLDTREHHEGNHSVRLHTPGDGKGIALRLFPFKVKAGESYAISIWAKCDPEQRLPPVTVQENERHNKNNHKQYVEIELGSFGKARFVPDQEWRRYMTFFSIPSDTLESFRTNLIIKMPGQGVAWIDDMKVFEENQQY
jgi:hypothetical protein